MSNRKFAYALAALFATGMCSPQASPPPRGTKVTMLTTKQIVDRAGGALVLIATRTEDGRDVARGSGFFISDLGVVATNLHVLKWASKATVRPLSDGLEYPVTEVLALDAENDICLLLISGATPTTVLPLDTSGAGAVGDDIIVAGNPEGLEGTFSKGIISGLRRNPDRLQIDAPISPGSSGGPVINMHGDVIGLATSTLTSGQNLNFAVPATFLYSLFDRAVQALGDSSDKASSRPPFISVRTAAAVAVKDRERDGLKGLVHRLIVKRRDPDTGEVVTESITTYGPEGRTIDNRSFDKHGGLIRTDSYSYREDGLLQALSSVDAAGNKHEHKYEDGVSATAAGIHFDETIMSGTDTDSHFLRANFDNEGNNTESVWRGTDGMFEREVCSFQRGRKVACSSYVVAPMDYQAHPKGFLASEYRYSYDDDAAGNWIVRHETMCLPNFPEKGYTPSFDWIREIDYY